MIPLLNERYIPDATEDPVRNRAVIARVHDALQSHGPDAMSTAGWRAHLRWSAHPDVLESLDASARQAWALDASRLCAHLGYTLGDLFADRAGECGEAVYLESLAEGRRLTFAEAHRRIRRIAAAFHAVAAHSAAAHSAAAHPAGAEPRVLIYSANSMESALCDLACLCHGILVAPVSVHTDRVDLEWMIDRLGITIAVTDSPERAAGLTAAAAHAGRHLHIIATDRDRIDKDTDILFLDDLIAGHGHLPLPAAPADPFATATVMFTSGSTGRPKGVCFSQHALVSKRFARAAALPGVGRNERLLAYLPLFHTFGRFLELQGMLFWRGRYVFAQDGSREALLAGLREVQPTGLVGVPLRWSQLADAGMAHMAGRTGTDARAAFRDLCGASLRWGLSAAGWLDPNVFRFFHQLGVDLCSGFGMTEATGGILMTPPGGYEDGAVGAPLPGIDVRLAESGELEIRGPYVASVLPAQGDLPVAAPSHDPAQHPWFRTGDIFVRHPSGQFEIVDRVKDIYKNARGQTVSPLGVEKLYRDIPGFRRVFVVGDGREYNVLLIVPDPTHPLFMPRPPASAAESGSGRPSLCQDADHDTERDGYIREIIRIANAQLASYERVVRYAVLGRDFDAGRGELTPKGSFNRAAILRAFEAEISALYRSRSVSFTSAGLTLHLPHWLLRELGLTEHDFTQGPEGGIINRATGAVLRIAQGRDALSWVIGDLEYRCPAKTADIGLLCRQPLGWIANPALVGMFPCREGWDAVLPPGMEVRMPVVSDVHVRYQSAPPSAPAPLSAPAPPSRTLVVPAGVSPRMQHVHLLLSAVLHGPSHDALALIDDVAMELDHGGRHIGGVIRARLGALAWHSDAELRCAAYASLLLYDPMPDESDAYAEFVRSGLPFLSDAAIRGITARDLRHGRLAALRTRLQRYRDENVFEGETGTAVVISILELLTSLAEHDPAYVFEVRAELCHWMRHEAERGITAYGSAAMFERLKAWYLARHADWRSTATGDGCLHRALRFDQGISADERARITALFETTPFLPLSLLMLHEIPTLACTRLAEGGVWISALPGFGQGSRHLVSITMRDGRHYQMQLLLLASDCCDDVLAGMHVFIALSGAASGARVLPRFGSYMPEAGAVSMQYVRGATVWDDLLRLSARRDHPADIARQLRSLFVRGMAAFITAWQQSSRSIIPGAAHPANVTVPADLVRGGAMIRSIEGWSPCLRAADLLDALRHHFFAMTAAHLPELRALLDPVWICEAAREALGDKMGMAFVEDLLDDLHSRQAVTDGRGHAPGHDGDGGCDPASEQEIVAARTWVRAMRSGWIAPLALDNAVACYREWEGSEVVRAMGLRERYARDLMRLFDIGRLGDLARFTLYRRTVFADARDDVAAAFDTLLMEMHQSPGVPATRLPAMNLLLDALKSDDERHALLRMVSPSADVSRHALQAIAGVRVLQRRVPGRTGETFHLRDAVGAAEIGMLYDLFLREQYPVVIGESMQYLVLVDEWHRIEGGAGYAFEDDGTLSVELLIIAPSVRGMGLGAATIDELLRRAADAGARQIRAPYYLRGFCLHLGFVDDPDNGDLRRAVPADDATKAQPSPS